MILYKTRRNLRKWLQDNHRFYKSLIISKFRSEGQKKVFIEIDEIALNRYLYSFIKFFKLKGYTVYIPKNKKVISTLNRKRGEFLYGSWILKEQVKLGKPKKPDLVITREQLSNDYFGKAKENSYHVPMSEYPGIYRNGIRYNPDGFTGNRKWSVFMSGNIDAAHYKKISKAGYFDIPSRRDVAEFIQAQQYYYETRSIDALRSFISGEPDHKVIIIDTSQQFRIPMNELKELLQGFHFYLALPGILIPQSHNLIEAMSVGCIPIIHKSYAELMHPILKHKETALIYNSLEELNDLILKSFNLEESQLDQLHENIFEYYDRHLSSSAVVKKVEQGDFSKIYIQAEYISLNILRD